MSVHGHPERKIVYENIGDSIWLQWPKKCTISNEKIQQAISKVIAEEEADTRNINLDAHNVTADIFSQTPVTLNTQGENETRYWQVRG